MHRPSILSRLCLSQLCLLLLFVLPTSVRADEPKFKILFNGKDLSGWKGLDAYWTVRDGAIVGQTTDDNPVKANTFLIWQGGEVSDFEFRCLVRFEGNNSGVQYRSELVDEPQLALAGYQADLHPRPDYMGMMYGEKTGRGIIAQGGQRIKVGADAKTEITAQLRPLGELPTDQWNELRIIAVGDRMVHQINGITTVDATDQHPDAKAKGLLGLQLHRGPAMKAEFRNLLMRPLESAEGKRVLQEAIDDTKLQGEGDDQSGANPNEKDLGSWLDESLPEWIWTNTSKDGQKAWFRKTITLPADAKSARVYATCDNRMTLYINGKRVDASNAWERPVVKSVGDSFRRGANVIAIEGQNEGGVAALVAKIAITDSDGNTHTVSTDSSWLVSESADAKWAEVEFDDSNWAAATTLRKLGGQPWGIPMPGGSGGSNNSLIDPHQIYAPPGFVVEQVYAVPREQGSWVSLATDPQGRLYACDQGGAGLFRITIRDGESPLVESVSTGDLKDLSGAQGLLWAFDSLWFHRNGGHLYRLTDQDADGNLDTVETYPGGTGGGEHGNHAVITTEDGKALYLDGGNHAPTAEFAGSRVPVWYEGHLLSRMWDSGGHARGRMAPGGWVTRLEVESQQQTLHTIGFRNQYDIALNRHGDLFTYDADMEWDLGLPWYRPTRICFVASGGDYGWRSGSGKWPAYYEDSLPAAVEIGPGSPTGVVSGAPADFPSRYRDAIFANDWTFGTMYAVHLHPDGAGYRGEAEPFVYGSPLPLTDVVIGNDGAMYFAVGGRGITSGLYRVRYIGDESRAAPTATDANSVAARKQRRALEAYHGIESPEALSQAWPHLSSQDRFLRHAARIAVESQPVSQWADRATTETDAQARITATVALARMGNETHREPAIKGLLELDTQALSESQLLGMLRGYSLIFQRLGKPTDEERGAVISQIDPLLPSSSENVNTELIRVLVYLRSESVIAKTLQLIQNRQTPEPPPWSELASRNRGYGGAIFRMIETLPPSREIQYAFMLRELRDGWTLDQRRDYFTFINEAAKTAGGASFAGYLTRMRDEALGNCPTEQRKALEEITGEDFDPKPDFPITEPVGPGKKWTVGEALAAARGPANFERGRSLFFSTKCASCHRVRGLGGAIGPDLTSIPNKFDESYLVEAIVHPSNHISDQYGSFRVLTDDGQVLTGLVVEKENGDLTVYPIDENAKAVEVAADSVELIEPSKISQMPEGLLDRLNAEEVRDLISYLMAAGNPNDRRFRR